VCVCVCVWEREREREREYIYEIRKANWFRHVYLKNTIALWIRSMAYLVQHPISSSHRSDVSEKPINTIMIVVAFSDNCSLVVASGTEWYLVIHFQWICVKKQSKLLPLCLVTANFINCVVSIFNILQICFIRSGWILVL